MSIKALLLPNAVSSGGRPLRGAFLLSVRSRTPSRYAAPNPPFLC